jgi:hypothetical protein
MDEEPERRLGIKDRKRHEKVRIRKWSAALAIAMTAGSAGAAAKSYQTCPANQGSGLVSTNGLSCPTALKVLAVAEGKPGPPTIKILIGEKIG